MSDDAVPLFLQGPEKDRWGVRKKRFRKPRRCEACGRADVIFAPPLICNECRQLLRDEWTRRQKWLPTVRRWRVCASVPTPDYTAPHSRLVNTIRNAICALVEQVGRYGDPNGRSIEDGDRVLAQVDSRRESSDAWCWVMTPKQAELVEAALLATREVVDQAYRDGFERGRRMITGLAEGSLSVNEVNAWCARYGQKEDARD